jgi:hypothetical protein
MRGTAALAFALSLAGGTLVAQDGVIRSLLSKDLAGDPTREVSTIAVDPRHCGILAQEHQTWRCRA